MIEFSGIETIRDREVHAPCLAGRRFARQSIDRCGSLRHARSLLPASVCPRTFSFGVAQ